MTKLAKIILSIFLVCVFFSSLNAVPVLRDGWPVEIENFSPINALNGMSTYKMTDGQTIISAANNGQIKVLDLDGNLLDGWPVTFAAPIDSGYIYQGPLIGDLDGDCVPEIVVLTIFGSTFESIIHRVLVYNLAGQAVDHLSKTFQPNTTTIRTATSCPTLADLDNDGDQELLFLRDSLFVINDDGSNFPGFPWAINDINNTRICGITVGIGEGWTDDTPILLWGTETKIHARHINATEELNGWPISFTAGNFYSPITLIPREIGWCAGIVDPDSIYMWNQNGQNLNGFPIYNHPVDFYSRQSFDLTASDVDGDGEPDILIRQSHSKLYGYNLQGQPLPGFPFDVGISGTGEPPVIMRDAESDSALIFTACAAGANREEITGFRYNIPLEEFLIQYDIPTTFAPYSQVALVPPQNGIMQIVFFIRTGMLYVYDYPLNTSMVHFEWPMQGNNASKNRMYKPSHFVTVDEQNNPSVIPSGMELNSLYPNPSNGKFRMEFTPSTDGNIDIAVYDINGRQVYSESQNASAGAPIIWSWDGCDNSGQTLASGTYLINLSNGKTTATRKAVLLK